MTAVVLRLEAQTDGDADELADLLIGYFMRADCPLLTDYGPGSQVGPFITSLRVERVS